MRTIPPELLNRIKKRWQVPVENANPKMKVYLSRGFLNELFQVFTIQEGDLLTDVDVTVRRPDTTDLPTEAFALAINNGVAELKAKPLPYDDQYPWIHHFTVASGVTSVAIEFDGFWGRGLGAQRFNFVTEDYPWLFYVQSGDLKARLYEDTPFILAEDVTKVASIRGWIPANGDQSNDQGLIVAYLKTDGNMYYRSYCIQDGGYKAWEVERQVTAFAGIVDDLALFRTNDFRVGFLAEIEGNIWWAMTERNWAGMSFEPEMFRRSPQINSFALSRYEVEYLTIVPFETFDRPPEVSDVFLNCCTVAELAEIIEATSAKRLSENIIAIEFSYNLSFKDRDEFVNTGIVSAFTIVSVDIINNKLTLVTAEAVPPSGVQLTIRGGYLIARMSSHCIRELPELLVELEMDEIPEQYETFNCTPNISIFNINQHVKVHTIHDEQPLEVFDTTPSVINFTIVILDVNGDPL